jgi:hypothetical protein
VHQPHRGRALDVTEGFGDVEAHAGV